MPVFIKKKVAAPKPPQQKPAVEPASPLEDLVAAGLVDPPKKETTIPTFTVGQRVTITAENKGSPASWKKGDSGRIKRLCKANGMFEKRPDDDMYFVELDVIRVTGKPVAYLKFDELSPYRG